MGVKKLKAIVVKAGKKIRPLSADPESLESLSQRVSDLKNKNWENMPDDAAVGRPACYGCIKLHAPYTAENNRKYKASPFLCRYSEQVNKYY
jgi:aldehyde:ferredoxin oxidoreductase